MTLLKPLFLCVFLLVFSMVHGQVKAVTETGDEVILSPNGTWKYKEDVKNNDSIVLNSTQYLKPSTANFLLKSNRSAAGFWLNSKKWNFEKSTDNNSEYSFSLKENTSIGAFVVPEPVSMELSALRKFAIENIQHSSSGFKILKEEYRQVNGLKLLLIESDAIIQGMQIIYFNYYYSDSANTVQFVSYYPKNLLAKYKNVSEELLNGFVIAPADLKADDQTQKNAPVQSSLVANSDCRGLFTGSWSYVANGKKYIDKLAGDKMFETNINTGQLTEYKVRWLDNCKYDLIIVRSNDPAMKLIKPGAIISIDIMEIDKEQMRFQLTYGESHTGGLMKKEN